MWFEQKRVQRLWKNIEKVKNNEPDIILIQNCTVGGNFNFTTGISDVLYVCLYLIMYGYYVHVICVFNVISFVYDIINVFAPHVLLIDDSKYQYVSLHLMFYVSVYLMFSFFCVCFGCHTSICIGYYKCVSDFICIYVL